MLPSKERLSRAEFTRYFSTGKRLHGTYFTFVLSPNLTFKASVVVSKKVAKKAHDRNLIKRRLYHCLQAAAASTGDLVGVYIVFVKPGAATLSKSSLAREFLSEFGRVTNKR